MAELTQQELERHLWSGADILRGTVGAEDYKQCIWPAVLQAPVRRVG